MKSPFRKPTASPAVVEPAAPPKRATAYPHKDFAKRFQTATDGNPHVPPPNFGRLKWFVTELEKHGVKSTPETVRKWFAGQGLPRHGTMKALAIILQVDEAWLSLGRAPEIDARQQKLRNAEADGVVNVVAGFVQMCGGNPAFPERGDKRAAREHIDIYAIIRGAQYAFHVALERDGHFAVPHGAGDTFVIGVVRTGDLAVSMFEIDAEALSNGKRKGGFTEVAASKDLRPITTFTERL